MAKDRFGEEVLIDDARELEPSRSYEVRDPAPPGMVEAIIAHLKQTLPAMGRGTAEQKAAQRARHRAWLCEMDRRYPEAGWSDEVLTWDRWVAKRYPAVAGPARDPAEPAWVREGQA